MAAPPVERQTKDQEPGFGARTARAEARPTAYRTFSPRLAPSLTAVGALCAAAGALGIWVRATEVSAAGAFPEVAAVVPGHADPAGWALFTLALVVALGAVAWTGRGIRVGAGKSAAAVPGEWLRAVQVVLAAVLVVSVTNRLLVSDGLAAGLVEEARASADFAGFHAGFGWGSWMLLLGAVLVTLGTVVGVLRQMDVGRGAR